LLAAVLEAALITLAGVALVALKQLQVLLLPLEQLTQLLLAAAVRV